MERRADEQAEWSTADREAPDAVARAAREEASATMSMERRGTSAILSFLPRDTACRVKKLKIAEMGGARRGARP